MKNKEFDDEVLKEEKLKKKKEREEKFKKCLVRLEEEKVIFGIPIKKRFLAIAGITFFAWLLFQILTVVIKPGFSTLEDRDKTYQELLEEQKKAVENGAVGGNQSFSEKNTKTDAEKYKEAVNEIKNLSNEEIRKLLKEQGMENVTDAEIEEMKKQMTESIPQTQNDMDTRIKEIEDAMEKLNQAPDNK